MVVPPKTKEEMNMKKKLCSVITALVLLCCLLPVTGGAAATSGTRAWVATQNRGTLNVRSSCSTGADNVITTLPWGTQITFMSYSNGSTWMYIQFNGSNYVGYGFVMSKYISFTNPGTPVTPPPQPVPPERGIDYSSFRPVTPYAVYANPTRATGWVNLRWAPSTDVDVIERCYQYRQLIVIAQNSSWAQVYDPDSGVVGFISRTYIKDLGYTVYLNAVNE